MQKKESEVKNWTDVEEEEDVEEPGQAENKFAGGVVALGSSDGSVRLLRRDAGQLSALRGPGGAVRCLRFHGPQLLLSAGSDGRVCLWTAAPPSLGAAGKALDNTAPGGSHAHP
ncbi:hypothetical protein WISP_53049 [Willisornis vidua]|uniref:Uncharacterized protein n=1 Tax=Willisornis vidua TaxID=1566151 RepID=A0ABQ9DD37_9PASS|nr:hypothetical protein WISP_53049 [Willisornis vidua]